MLGATNDEVRTSFESMGLICGATEVSFPDSSAARINIPLRMQQPHQIVFLTRLLAHLSYEEIHFRSARLWITATDIWNPLEEGVCLRTLEQFRRSYGETRSLESAPGTNFRHDQFVESVCCLLQPMLVGWDAFYVPIWAYGGLDYFLAVSHDGFVDVEIRTKEKYEEIAKILTHYKWIEPSTE